MVERIGDPVHVLLDRRDHLRLHAGAAGPCDDEHVGEARDHQAEIGEGAALPMVGQHRAVARPDVDLAQRAGHGVEAGGEDDGVELVLFLARTHALLCDVLDRIAAHIDQHDVVAIVGLVIVRIEAEPLGADRVILRRQQLGRRLVLHDDADLVAGELRGRVVGLLVHQKIGVGVEVADAAALLPLGLVGGVALLLGGFEGRLGRPRIAADREGRVVGGAPAGRILRLVAALALFLHRRVARRQAEIGGALEHMQMFGLLRDQRDHLDARGARADDADPQPGEVDTLMRPQARMVPLALEAPDALEAGHARRREIARRHDAVARADFVTLVGA